MKFCPYCGKQLGDDEVCSCQNANTNNETPETAENTYAAPENTENASAENTSAENDGYYYENNTGADSAAGEAKTGNGGDILSKLTGLLKGKSAIAILGAVAAVIVLCVIIGVIAGSGPKKKIANAFEKTFNDSGYLFKDLSKFKLNGDKMTYSVSAKYDDLGVNASIIINGNEKAVTAKISDDGDTVIEAAAMVDKKDVKVCFPGLDYKKLLVYRYTAEEKEGLEKFADKKTIEALDSAIKALYDASASGSGSSDKLAKTIKKWVDDLETNKVESKSFKVDGEKRDCKGYEIVLTEDNLEELLDHITDWLKEEYGETLEDSLGKDGFDDIFKDAKKSLKGMDEISLKCYLYKGMIAAIVLENKDDKITAEFNGGDYRTQEINVYSGKKSDDKQILKVSGKVRDSKETVNIEIPNSYALEYSYDKSSGKFSVSVQQYSYWSDNFQDIGTVKGKLDISGSKVSTQITSIDVNGSTIKLDDLTVEISSKASMPKMKGTEFRIDEADKDDIEDEIKELTGELTDAIYDSNLKDLVNNLMYNGFDF